MTQSLFPCLCYRDARGAIAFLQEAFGFAVHAVHADGDRVEHAEIGPPGALVMLGSVRGPGDEDLLDWPPGSACLYLVVEDPDAHHDRAVAAGAQVVRGLRDEEYGSRGYTARDPEGNLWSFGTYAPAPASASAPAAPA